MDIEVLLSQVESEIKQDESDFRGAVNKFFAAIKDTEADLDTPINDLLNEMKIMNNNLVILRGIRIAMKREMNEARKAMVNR